MPAERQSKHMHIIVSAAEYAILAAVAERRECGMTEVVRSQIRKLEHGKRGAKNATQASARKT